MKYSNRLHLNAAALAVLAALAASSAIAADTVSTETVKVTAARVEQELQDVNMSVSVITAEDIAHSEARSIGELLKDIPGIRINNDGGQGIKRVSIRGESAFRTLVMIDGQKISEQKSMSGSPMLIDPSQVERIEVIKGPSSVLYGSDAIGGAINIITKKGGKKALEGDVSIGMDTSSSGRQAAFSIAGQKDGWHYRLGAAYEKGDELDTPAGEMANTGFSSKSANFFLAYDITDKAQVGLTLDHHDLEFMSGSVTYAKDEFFVDVPEWKRTKVGLFAEVKDINNYLSRIRADVFYQKNKKTMQNFVNTPEIHTLRRGGTAKVYTTVDNHATNDLDQYGVSLQADWTLSENNFLITGYEYGRDDLDSVTKSQVTPVSSFPAFTIPSTTPITGQAETHAIFAAMETTLGDFILNYGARYTYVKTEVDAYKKTYDDGMAFINQADGLMGHIMSTYSDYSVGSIMSSMTSGGSSSSAQSGHNDRVVFNAGVLYNGIDNLTLRASWAQGFRAPLLQERYINTSMGGATTYANPELKPETSNNFEIGARYLNGPVSLDAAAFLSLADDYIASMPTGVANTYKYDNVAKAKTYGLELSGSVRLGTTGFEPYANVTLMRRQYDNGNGFKTYETGTPTLWARYGVRWSRDIDGLLLRTDMYANSQTASKYDDGKTTDSSSYRYGGATTFNVAGGVSFGPEKQYKLDMGLYNIGDKKYQNDGAIYEPGRYFAMKFNAHF